MNLPLGEHIGFLGSTGSGKTHRYRSTVEPVFPREIVVDTEYDLRERSSFDFDDLPEVKGTGVAVGKAIDWAGDKAFRWRWHPDPNDIAGSVEILCQHLLMKGRDMVVYFDEISDYSSALVAGNWLKQMPRKGRKRRITVAWGTQRAAGVNHWFLSNSDHLFVTYLKPDELALMPRYFGADTIARFRTLHYGKVDGIWDFLYRDPRGTWRNME